MKYYIQILEGIRISALWSWFILWFYSSEFTLEIWWIFFLCLSAYCLIPEKEDLLKMIKPKAYMIWEFDDYEELQNYLQEEIEDKNDEKNILVVIYKKNKENIALVKTLI